MSVSSPVEGGRCPVCQARFRGASVCSRCGATLRPLLLLAAHAYRLRQAAREALRNADLRSAVALCRAAQGLHTTPEGTLLTAACARAACGDPATEN